MAILDFSVSGWHGFGSVTQVCFGISVSNFMCMSFVSVGRCLKIASYVAFKMAALWFWTMFNCNPPIAHCHPLLWGGGILVDHWSTISSCYWQTRILTTIAHAQTNRRASRVSALALLLNKSFQKLVCVKPDIHMSFQMCFCITYIFIHIKFASPV